MAQILSHRQAPGEVGLGGTDVYYFAYLSSIAACIKAHDGQTALFRVDQSREYGDERGLAWTVGAQQAKDLSYIYIQRYIIKDGGAGS